MYKVILLGDTEYEQSHVVTQITKVHNQMIPTTVSKDLLEYEQSHLVIQITKVHSGGFRV
jgi:hypothetical protein